MKALLQGLVAIIHAHTQLPTAIASEMLDRIDGIFEEPEFKVHADCLLPSWPDAVPPSCETVESAGYDLPAYLWEPVTIMPGDTKIIRTGWSVKMPSGVEAQVRSRSGLAAKFGVTVLNSPGTIEPDYYPNDIKVILHNGGVEPFVVNHGDRIAQAVFARFIKASNGVQKDTIRDGGLGSTGGR